MIVNIPNTKKQFYQGVSKLLEASKTNFTNFSSIDEFSTSQEPVSVLRIIVTYLSYTLIPFIFLVILLEFNIEIPICYDIKATIQPWIFY